MWHDEERHLTNGVVRVRTWFPNTELPDAASAPTVVLVHGLGGSVLDWYSLAPLLARDRKVVAFDLPGFGRSGPALDGTYGLQGQINTLAEVVASETDSSQGGYVDLIGNSMGGLVAIHFSAWAPENVRSLTLLSPAMPERKPRLIHLPALAFGSRHIGASLFSWFTHMPLDAQLKSKVDVCFSGAPVPAEWRSETELLLTDLQASDDLAPAYVAAANDLLHAAFGRGPSSSWGLAQQLVVPTLVTHSAKDELVVPNMRFAWAKQVPQSRRVYFTSAGHVPMLSAPEAVEMCWRNFVRSLG